MKGTWATYLIIPNMAIAMNYNKMREIDLNVFFTIINYMPNLTIINMNLYTVTSLLLTFTNTLDKRNYFILLEPIRFLIRNRLLG